MAAQPLLPYARSFLVQFTADTDPGLKRAAGRVEHLKTGQQSRFASHAALRECIATVLGSGAPLAPEPPSAEEARGRRAKSARKRASTRRRPRARRK